MNPSAEIDKVLRQVGYGPGGDRESAPGLTDDQAKLQLLELINEARIEELRQFNFHISGTDEQKISKLYTHYILRLKDLSTTNSEANKEAKLTEEQQYAADETAEEASGGDKWGN